MQAEIALLTPHILNLEVPEDHFVRVIFPSVNIYKPKTLSVTTHPQSEDESKSLINMVQKIYASGEIPVVVFRLIEPKYYSWNSEKKVLTFLKPPPRSLEERVKILRNGYPAECWDFDVKMFREDYITKVETLCAAVKRDNMYRKSIPAVWRAVLHIQEVYPSGDYRHDLAEQAIEFMRIIEADFGHQQPYEQWYPNDLKELADEEMAEERDEFVLVYLDHVKKFHCPQMLSLIDVFALSHWQKNGYKYPEDFFKKGDKTPQYKRFHAYIASLTPTKRRGHKIEPLFPF